MVSQKWGENGLMSDGSLPAGPSLFSGVGDGTGAACMLRMCSITVSDTPHLSVSVSPPTPCVTPTPADLCFEEPWWLSLHTANTFNVHRKTWTKSSACDVIITHSPGEKMIRSQVRLVAFPSWGDGPRWRRKETKGEVHRNLHESLFPVWKCGTVLAQKQLPLLFCLDKKWACERSLVLQGTWRGAIEKHDQRNFRRLNKRWAEEKRRNPGVCLRDWSQRFCASHACPVYFEKLQWFIWQFSGRAVVYAVKRRKAKMEEALGVGLPE